MIRFVIYESCTDNVPSPAVEASWEDFAAFLSTHEERAHRDAPVTPRKDGTVPEPDCAEKDGAAWSPGICLGRRLASQCQEVTCLVLDVDGGDVEGTLRKVAGYRRVTYSTHRYDPAKDKIKLRVVLPLARPVPGKQWTAARAAMLRALGVSDQDADPTCKDPGRLYYLPSCHPGADRLAVVGEGAILDPSPYLVASDPAVRADLDAFARSIRPARLQAPPDPAAPVDVDAVMGDLRAAIARKAKQTGPKAKDLHELLCRVRDGRALAAPGHDASADPLKGRDSAINRTASCLANVLHGPPPWAAVLEVMRPSLGATDLNPEGWDHWVELAKKKYERARERLKARQEADRAAVSRFLTGKPAQPLPAAPGEGSPPPPATPPAPPVPEHVLGPPEDGEDPDDPPPAPDEPVARPWTEEVIRVGDEGERIDPCGPNIELFLANLWGRDAIWWDDVTKEVRITAGPGAGFGPATASVAIHNYLYKSEARVKFPIEGIKAQLMAWAERNKRDPLRDYLRSLTWDGQPRASTWLARLAGADESAVPAEYLHEVGRRWLVAAVARALAPGSKMDTVLILEGTYGLQKSALFGVLGGEWFNDTAITVGDKDSRMLAAVCWISEMPELAAARRTDNEGLKGFLSQRIDNFRPPYGDAMKKSPRRAVFVGTVNPDEYPQYLKGDTWRRRFWIVPCTRDADVRGAREERDQLLAEAVAVYDAALECEDCAALSGTPLGEPLATRCPGHRWWFDRHEWEPFVAIGRERVESQSQDLGHLIEQWFLAIPRGKRPLRVQGVEVAQAALDITPERFRGGAKHEVATALKDLGFESRPSNGKSWWVTPRELLEADGRAPHLTPVPMPGKTTEDKK